MLADYLANLQFALDNGKSWSRTSDRPFQGHTVKDCNLVVWSDGGTRRDKCSSSAWFAEVGHYSHARWNFRPLAMGGTYFEKPISSFVAETLALHECSFFIRNLVQHNTLKEPLGKRRPIFD